jgi:LuxR family transcriptional regulator, maltose regulon positive regulatory protein
MTTPVLATKLYKPPPRSKIVQRPLLIARLNQGLQGKLTLISAPAGFGKSTLTGEWTAACARPVAWLSLDEGDSDPARFLTYVVAALQTIFPNIAQGVMRALQSPQPPAAESILTSLLNDIVAIPDSFVLVLDDYHVIDSRSVDNALTFLLDHMPPQMHLVIATREDPHLPLARLRARDQLSELRDQDLRFTLPEAAEFLNQTMALNVSADDIAALEARTEGWVAGLQLAAISMQGHHDTASFVSTFTGSHHFVMDYLVEEILKQQPESIQTFLLRTSILDRLCGPLCDAVCSPDTDALSDSPGSGQTTLEYLERANLFIIPLDNERRWYRYHHLFADLLRQRLHQSLSASSGKQETLANELHIRASQWYEDNGLDIEAFHHAAAANDIERAERLIDGRGIPLHLRGAVMAILDWLESLPITVLNERPWLWWRHASLLLVNGQTTGVEEKLDAAEAALQGTETDERTQNFIGKIAAARAVLALTRYEIDTMIVQSRRALEYLHPDSRSTRANANWTLGFAYLFQREYAASRHALTEAIALSRAAGDIFTTILATVGLGNVQEGENQLYMAAETYQNVLKLAGEQPLQIVYEAHLGLARIFYEWNDLDTAEKHGLQSLDLARQYDKVIDRFIICEIFLARLKLAQGDVAAASAMIAQAHETTRQKSFVHRLPDVAEAQVLILLRQGNIAAAANLAFKYDLPFSRARVHLAQGDTAAALAVLGRLRDQLEEKDWLNEKLRLLVLEAIAHYRADNIESALHLLHDALVLADHGGFIRLFLDEGTPMEQLLSEAAARGMLPDTIGKLLSAFDAQTPASESRAHLTYDQGLIEPLSQRELEVLQLIANGLSNHEISERLFLALSTVKGHNQKIFDKLQVQRRTEAIVRARELGLL